MNCGIYYIKSLVNGKIYIGSSKNISYRIKQHINRLTKYTYANSRLQKDFNLYGLESFEFKALEYTNANRVVECEQGWIDYFDSCNHGYNIMPKANMCEHSEEVKHKIGESNRGKHGGLVGDKNPFYGRKHSEETRRKISEKMKERMKNPENNYFYGKKLTGDKNGMYGKTHSEEARKKIGERQKGKKLSEQHVKILKTRVPGMLGRKMTTEQRIKMSENNWKVIKYGRKKQAKTC